MSVTVKTICDGCDDVVVTFEGRQMQEWSHIQVHNAPKGGWMSTLAHFDLCHACLRKFLLLVVGA